MSAPVSFNARELGRLAVGLQRVCSNCARAFPQCGAENRPCPVGTARDAIGAYLFSSQQVNKKADLTALPRKPPEATFDEKELREVLAALPPLCNRCMFHVENCFLNVVYTCLELALQLRGKPPGQRPAEEVKPC